MTTYEDMTFATCATKNDVLYVRTPVHAAPEQPTFGTICHPKNHTTQEARVFGLALAYPDASKLPHETLAYQVAYDLESLFRVAGKDERQIMRAWAWLLGKELAHGVFVSSNGTGDAPSVMEGTSTQKTSDPLHGPSRYMWQGAVLRGCPLRTSHEAERTFWTLLKVWRCARQGNDVAHDYETGSGAASEAEARLAADVAAKLPTLESEVRTACQTVRDAAARSHINLDTAWKSAAQTTLAAYAQMVEANHTSDR